MSSSLFPANTVFAGDFRVVRLLRSGGMGSVYLVEQESTGKLRALKLLASRLRVQQDIRQRFEREARAASLIDSDHVVEVVTAGIDDATNLPFLVMELLSGEDLGDAIARRERLALVDVVEIFRQIGHALERAHRRGIVHRDLKPENIFLAEARRPDVPFTAKLLDFGVAKFLAPEGAGAQTQPVGSPLFMAPEQTELSGEVGPGTDVWALGLLAFYLLTGKSYWIDAETSGVPFILRQILFDPMPSASARERELGDEGCLFAGFDAWFARCTQRVVADRYAEGGACARAFVELATQSQQPSQKPFPPLAVPRMVSIDDRSSAPGSFEPPALQPKDLLLPVRRVDEQLAATDPGAGGDRSAVPLWQQLMSLPPHDLSIVDRADVTGRVSLSEVELVTTPPALVISMPSLTPGVTPARLTPGAALFFSAPPPAPEAPEPASARAPASGTASAPDALETFTDEPTDGATDSQLHATIDVHPAPGPAPAPAKRARLVDRLSSQRVIPWLLAAALGAGLGGAIAVVLRPKLSLLRLPPVAAITLREETGDLDEDQDEAADTPEPGDASGDARANGGARARPALPSDPACGKDRVRVSERTGDAALCMDAVEVTSAAFDACVRAGACAAPRNVVTSERIRGDLLRVLGETCVTSRDADSARNCVTLDEARAYCTSRDGRLPRESEWTRAFTSGGKTHAPWGDDPATALHGNGCDLDCAGWAVDARIFVRPRVAGHDGFASVAPVGAFPLGASRDGALDLAGNVAEWVESDRPDADVACGASFFSGSLDAPGCADVGARDVSLHDVGFRCVYDLD